jgi:hypothetical protein
MMQREILFKVLDALEAVGIPYMLVGSFASSYWGRPRGTHDADLVVEIAPDQAAELAHLLQGEFYAPEFAIREAAELRSHTNVIHLELAFKVDLWVRKDTAYDRERFRRRRKGTMFDREVWISSAEDTILSKLLWYTISPVLYRQYQDSLEVYEVQEPDLDQAYLDDWAQDLGLMDLLAQVREQAARPAEVE